MNSQNKTDGVKLMLDDLSVGQIFRSESYVIDAEKIKAFASEFDPQPFHLDEEAAVGTFFNELVASGWHTAGITMRLLVGSLPIAGGLVGAGTEITWPRPTRPGDCLTVESEVMEIKPSTKNKERGMVTVRSTTTNQDGKTVQIVTSRMVVPRRVQETLNSSAGS